MPTYIEECGNFIFEKNNVTSYYIYNFSLKLWMNFKNAFALPIAMHTISMEANILGKSMLPFSF